MILKNGGSSLPLFEHIQELRKHVFYALFWLVFFSLIAFLFMKPIVTFLKEPYEHFLRTAPVQNITQNLSSIGVFEVITVNFKVCFLVGFICSLPFTIRELWKFIRPALYETERKLAIIALFSSIILFYSGLSFGFFLIIPYFFSSALTWASQYAQVMITYDSYFNSLITLMLVFAIIFEVPVILSLLGLAGILPSAILVKNRKIVFLGCFIVGAILAPPDVMSLCLVALPLYFMVEISIFFIKNIEKKRAKQFNSLK